MKIRVTLELDVTPGTMSTEEEISADAVSNLKGSAEQLGFGYGPVAYTVNAPDAS